MPSLPLVGRVGVGGVQGPRVAMTRIDPHTRANAKRLRATPTPQERRIWAGLRDLNRAFGAHFRRQAPIGPYIADFADYGARLVIEIDGGQHGGAEDTARDAFLARQGFRVLRFWNFEVVESFDGVLERVLDIWRCPPPPAPPHEGEGRRPTGTVAGPSPTSGAKPPPSPSWGGAGGGGPCK